MNLNKLFEIQNKLDQAIVKKKGLEGQDLLPMKILALQVELGELANEWRGFKFWSEDKESRIAKYSSEYLVLPDGREVEKVTNPLLEEYVDCLHFILSIGIDIKVEEYLYDINNLIKPTYGTITEHFINMQRVVLNLYHQEDFYSFVSVLGDFVKLGEMLGFTWEQIEQAYLSKNKVNHERQESGY